MDSTLYLGKGVEGVDGVVKIKSTQTGTDTDELGLSFFVHGSASGTTPPSEALSIKHDGNVGIGTTSPLCKFHVRNSDESPMIIDGSTAYESARFTSTSAGRNISLLSSASTFSNYIGSLDTNHSLRFFTTKLTDGSRNTHMTITEGGNVGIGTTDPKTIHHISRESDSTNYAVTRFTADTQSFDVGVGGSTVSNTGLRNKFYIYDSSDVYASSDVRIKLVVDSTGNVGIGTTNPSSKLEVNGSFSATSKSFKIDHPLPEKSETHDLYHVSIEGPTADLIYRGVTKLENGIAEINIDSASRMTEGTFEALCTNVQCFTTNETSWDLTRGKVTGNILKIECQDPNCTDEISWMVIGERKDKSMLEHERTDDNGRLVPEWEKPEPEYEMVESEEVVTEEPVAEEAPVEEPQAESDPEIVTKEDGKEYIRIGDKDYEVLGKNEDGSLLLDDDTTNNG